MNMLKLLADENIPQSTVRFLRDSGCEVVSAKEAGLAGKSDREIIEFATSRGLTVLTLDLEFGQRYYFEAQPPCGVMVLRVKPANPENVNTALRNFLDSEFYKGHRLESCLTIISKGRVRIIGK